jgi:hypothetical protein
VVDQNRLGTRHRAGGQLKDSALWAKRGTKWGMGVWVERGERTLWLVWRTASSGFPGVSGGASALGISAKMSGTEAPRSCRWWVWGHPQDCRGSVSKRIGSTAFYFSKALKPIGSRSLKPYFKSGH